MFVINALALFKRKKLNYFKQCRNPCQLSEDEFFTAIVKKVYIYIYIYACHHHHCIGIETGLKGYVGFLCCMDHE